MRKNPPAICSAVVGSRQGIQAFLGPVKFSQVSEADRLVGDAGAFLVIDDTAMTKKGRHSVGVAPQCASSLGKNANRQTLGWHRGRCG